MDFEARQSNQRSVCLLCWLVCTRTERTHHEAEHERRGDYKNVNDKDELWASPKLYSSFAWDSSVSAEEQTTSKKIKRLAKKMGFLGTQAIQVIKCTITPMDLEKKSSSSTFDAEDTKESRPPLSSIMREEPEIREGGLMDLFPVILRVWQDFFTSP